ncbi:MAG: PatB family C-S lyase [Candidatus Krumholzibacteriia bacterium]
MSGPDRTYDFDRPPDRRSTDSIKWRRYAGRDVLPLWVADMDFASPPAVVDALVRRVGHRVFGYAEPLPELTAAVLGHLERDFGWTAEPDWLVWLPGLVSGLSVCCRAVGEPGDAVFTHTPIYPPFLKVPAAMDRQVTTVPLVCGSGGWAIDPDATAGALADERTRLFLLCSPHNPCGRVWTRHELERLADLCLAHDVVICSDEIHNQLVLDPDRRHLPTALLSAEVAARTITLMAPSKTFNVAGLGCSFAVIPDAGLRRRFRRAMAGIVPHVNALGLTAALAAYTEGEPWRQALLEYLRKGRDMVQAEVAALPGLTMAPVEATYLAWIDARGLDLADPVAHLEEHGLGLSDGRDFGAPGFVRLNFGCAHAVLREALARLRQAVAAS